MYGRPAWTEKLRLIIRQGLPRTATRVRRPKAVYTTPALCGPDTALLRKYNLGKKAAKVKLRLAAAPLGKIRLPPLS